MTNNLEKDYQRVKWVVSKLNDWHKNEPWFLGIDICFFFKKFHIQIRSSKQIVYRPLFIDGIEVRMKYSPATSKPSLDYSSIKNAEKGIPFDNFEILSTNEGIKFVSVDKSASEDYSTETLFEIEGDDVKIIKKRKVTK